MKMFVNQDGLLLESISNNKPILLILLLAFIVRIAVMWVYPDQYFPDAVAYKTIGKEIFAGQIITNNIYMPLYPIISFLTGGGKFQILFDILISVISVWLIFLLSVQLFKDTLAGYIAAIISALYPHFLFYSVVGLTEVSFTFLLILSCLLFYREKIFLAILVSILAILVKPTFDYLNPFLVILFCGVVHSVGWKKTCKFVGVYFLFYILIMSFWWFHQYHKYDKFVRLTLSDGIILYSGNNPLNASGGGVGRDSGASDMDLGKFDYIQNPIDRNNAMKTEAFKYISENPGRFIELSGVKFVRFWRLWPYTEHYQQWYIVASSILSYGVVLFLSIGFLIRCTKKYFRELLPIYSIIGYLTFVHMITIGSIRYRFPIEPFLIIFASYFLIDIVREKNWFSKLAKIMNIDLKAI